MIKCIIFDLGAVIVKNNPHKACSRLTKVCPHNADEVSWFAPPKVHKLMDTGKVTKQYLYRQAVRNLGLKNVSQKKFEKIYADIFSDNTPVQNIALKLKKNYKLVLLSNTDPIHFDFIKKNFPIISIFTKRVVSYKVGYVKPHRQIFREALRKAGCMAGECIFIDDKKRNVAGARKLGIKSMQYTTPAKLRAGLLKLGVEL